MGVGDTLSNAVLEFALRAAIPIYVSLHTAEPEMDLATPNTHETSGTNYAREFLAPADWTAAADGASQTVAAVTFAAAGSSWGTITYVGLFNALTGGDLLWWGELAIPRAIGPGDTIGFPAGNLVGQAS